jgi:rare lipoprotein A
MRAYVATALAAGCTQRRLTDLFALSGCALGLLLCAHPFLPASGRAPAAADTVAAVAVTPAFSPTQVVSSTKGDRLTAAVALSEATARVEAALATEDASADAAPLPRSRPGLAAADPASVRLASAGGGLASYYQPETLACGGAVVPQAMTAAHRSLPCGTVVKVTNTKTGRYAMVQINDRGPFIKGRVIDVSRTAAHELDMIGPGIVPVKLEVVK